MGLQDTGLSPACHEGGRRCLLRASPFFLTGQCWVLKAEQKRSLHGTSLYRRLYLSSEELPALTLSILLVLAETLERTAAGLSQSLLRFQSSRSPGLATSPAEVK